MRTRLFATLSVAFIFYSSLFAQTVAPDPSFGHNGRSITNFLSTDDQGFALQVRPDGRIQVAGRSLFAGKNQFAVLQFLPNGSLDESFNRDGRMVQKTGPDEAIAYAAALLPGGQTVVAGFEGAESFENFSVLKVTPEGYPDTSFAQTGFRSLNFNDGQDFCYAVLHQPDDKIVLAGYTSPDGFESNFALTRLLSNGSTDGSFGDNGAVVNSFSTVSDLIFDAELQPDGYILAAGQIYNEDFSSDFIVARYQPNGQLDSTFGNAGISVINLGNDDLARGIALQPDGKIIVAGIAVTDLQPQIGVARLLSNGALDADFGNNGILILNTGPLGIFCTDVLVEPGGKILLSGMVESIDFRDFFIMRRLADGSPDPSFGTAGTTITSASLTNDNAYRMARQPDGKILLAGTSEIGALADFALLRYTSDGKLDPDFGKNGIVLTDVGSSYDHLFDLAVQPDDKILACGYGFEDAANSMAIARYLDDGNRDSSFNEDGLFTSIPDNDHLEELALLPGGKMIAAGSIQGVAGLVRLNPDGTPDPGFGNNGIATSSFGAASSFYGLAVRPDGSILAGGHSDTENDILVQYTPQGNYDLNFGINGQIPLLTGFYAWYRLKVLSDGAFLALGRRILNGQIHPYLVKFQSSGLPDLGFASNGLLPDCGFPQAFLNVKDFAILPSGKILVTGGDEDFSVCRLNADGTLDNTFGNAGTVSYDLDQLNNVPFQIAVQSDGKIVIAGRSSESVTADADMGFTVLRLEPDGAPDTTFGLNGFILLHGILASSVAIQSTGDIIAGGEWFNGHDSDVLLYRLLETPSVGVVGQPDTDLAMVNLYPNPVSTSLQIEYELAENQPVSINCFDESGRLVATFLNAENRNAGMNRELVNLPQGLSQGYYTVTIATKTGSKAMKIIKK